MSKLKQKNWAWLFLGLHLLLLSQVLWWAIVFCRDVELVRDLKRQNHQLLEKLGAQPFGELAQIDREARAQKTMFVSESVFFALVASLALWLLFKALKREEKALNAQRNFIEVISHESKTPLTALKLRLESVQEKLRDDSLSVDLTRALEEVRRLSGILEKALELNRLERFSMSSEPVDISELLTDLLRRMDPVFRQKNVQIASEMEEGALVRGDVFCLENSLQSLLENAVQYNDSKDKKVWVSLEKNNSAIVISVKDNGPGVSEKEESQIFDRFYRGRAGKRVPGTGLGLYLSRQIIQAHQGVLRLVRCQEGAHFEIKLPRSMEAT